MPSSAKIAGPSVNVGMQLPLVKHTHPTDRLVQELYCGLELVVPSTPSEPITVPDLSSVSLYLARTELSPFLHMDPTIIE